LKSDLNYPNKGLDDQIKHAMQGEKLFHYYHIEHQNLDRVLHDIGIELSLLEKEKKVVQAQLEQMECGGCFILP
jgi:hypothetical protein